ncbi:MAG: zeta toxin family protein [Kiritimatiellae bacterium]|nr:zeta toxin family protein [Kiritimatiellia bacterium]MDD5520179.1 zeta toxin family protein [Kiritimatiellia bacterium]
MKKSAGKHLYVIAGSNGAGKTTFAREFLPDYAHCLRFINPDLIAAGLSPFDPSAATAEAGKVVLREVQRAIRGKDSFAFESTLSGRTYLYLLRQARDAGFELHLFYLWIPSPDLALARIRDRVEAGGHNVPELDVRRRYPRSLRNSFTLYAPEMGTVHFFDNSGKKPNLIFKKESGRVTVLNRPLYAEITRQVTS